MEKNKIIIGADIVPTKSNENLFIAGEIEKLLGDELCSLLKEGYSIFNLEVPLTVNNQPIKKYGPTLSAHPNSISGLKKMGIKLVTLSNNHIMDQGDRGLFDTIQGLNENGISYVGAGENLEKAEKPFIFSINSKIIGVYACAEHEFSIAGKNQAGANPFDPIDSFFHIKELKRKCDFVIILYHGGKEFYPYPSPNLQKVCRAMIKAGANLVLCQHSHCIGCMENVDSGTIIYGQGNFIFDGSKKNCWQTSLLVEITVDLDFKIRFIPISKDEEKVRLANERDRRTILEDFYARSQAIKVPNFLEEQYDQISKEMLSVYLNDCMGKLGRNIFFRILNRLSKRHLLIKNYDKSQLLILQNVIECEAHRELFLNGLKVMDR